MKKTFVVLAFLVALDSRASSVTGALRGRVVADDHGVAGAAVTASCYGSAGVLETRSAVDGHYWFPTLAPGLCEVTFAKDGLQTLTQRVEVCAGDETRADVTLEASAEGERVTSTSTRGAMLERPQVVWTIDDQAIDLLPLRRSADGLMAIAPGDLFADDASSVEGVRRRGSPRFAVLDAIGRADVSVAAPDPLVAPDAGRIGLLSLRSHGTLDLTARVTGEHLEGRTRGVVDVTAGGIVSDALHLFAAARGGSLFERNDESDWLVAADAAAGSATALRAVALGGDGTVDWSARGTRVLGRRFTADLDASDGDTRVVRARGAMLVEGARSVHEVRAGIERQETFDGNAFFVDDHWIFAESIAFDAGVRVDDGDLHPRAGLMVDPARDGRQRFALSFGEYAGEASREIRETAFSYAQQFDGGTAITATLLRRERDGERPTEGVMLDAAYRYLVFSFGGNLTVAKQQGELRDSANVWVIADAPLLEHDVNVALLERLREDFHATDLAVTYSWTAGRVRPSAKLEFENLFDAEPRDEGQDQRPRAIRLSAGVRFGLD